MEQKYSSKELVDKIIKEEHLHPGDKISYERFVEISNKYSISQYTLAVDVLGVSQAQLNGLRSNKSNAKAVVILKSLIPEMKKKALSLKDEIMENEKLSEGDLIDYERIKIISEKYDISERILAIDVLEITQYAFVKIKNNPDKKALCFQTQKNINKQKAKKDEETNQLRKQILESEHIKIGDKINYERLIELSNKYKIEENKLASDILGITKGDYNHIKYDKKRNTIVLKGFLDEKELSILAENIIEKEDIKPYDQINYEELEELSNKYLINNKILALNILGITESQYWNMKYNAKMKAYVLKRKYKVLSVKELKGLKEKVFKEEKIAVGSRISYDEIQRIKEKYNISINETLYLLGVTKHSYEFVKWNQRYCAIVKDMDKLMTTHILSEIIEKERYYTKQELEEICKINNITTQDFFDYVFGKAMYFGCYSYKDVLEKKGKIWIGEKGKLSKEFVDNNIEDIMRIANKASTSVYYKYKSNKRKIERKDLEQDAVIIILEKCGDLEKNFDADDLLAMMYTRARVHLLSKIGEERNVTSLTGYYRKSKERSLKGDGRSNTDLDVKDETVDVEREVIEKSEIEENPIIKYLSELVEKGYDRNTSLERTSKKFGVSKKTMLKVLKNALYKRKREDEDLEYGD